MPFFEPEDVSVAVVSFCMCIYGCMHYVCTHVCKHVLILPAEAGGQTQVPVREFTSLNTKVLLFTSVTTGVDDPELQELLSVPTMSP